MKAWRFYAINDMRLDEVPDPQVQPGGVVVQVTVTQPSVTEVIRARGEETLGADYVREAIAKHAPVQLLGHEFAGVVVQVGEGVTSLIVGDRVASGRSRMPCYKCELCLSGQSDYCRKGPSVGRQIPGCFAEYVSAPAEIFVKLPVNVSDNEGACIQALTGSTDAVHTAEIQMGDTIAVFGQGTMGLAVLQIAKASGAGMAITVDVRDDILELSKKFGADVTINARADDPVKRILELTHGKGADVVFEAAGGSTKQGLAGAATLKQAFKVVRDVGKVVQVAMFDGVVDLDLNQLRAQAIKYLFPAPTNRKLMEYTVHLVATGQVTLKPTITHVLQGLDKLPEAFEITANKGKYKALNPAQVVV
jgi:threonine dehydrogenase-like Zn-dependent dehydrogenase